MPPNSHISHTHSPSNPSLLHLLPLCIHFPAQFLALPQLVFPGFHTVLKEGKLHGLTVLATSALLARVKQLERGQRKGSGLRGESVKGLGVVRPRTVVRV